MSTRKQNKTKKKMPWIFALSKKKIIEFYLLHELTAAATAIAAAADVSRSRQWPYLSTAVDLIYLHFFSPM